MFGAKSELDSNGQHLSRTPSRPLWHLPVGLLLGQHSEPASFPTAVPPLGLRTLVAGQPGYRPGTTVKLVLPQFLLHPEASRAALE